jgi:hypothetical protein
VQEIFQRVHAIQVSFQCYSHLTSCYQELILPLFPSSSNFHVQLYTRAMLSLQVTLQWLASTVDRSDPTMANEFKCFSRLPFEIRRKIWLHTVDLFPQILPFRPSLPLFYLLVGDLTPDNGRIGKFSRQISQKFYISTTSLVTRFGPITSFLPPKRKWNLW